MELKNIISHMKKNLTNYLIVFFLVVVVFCSFGVSENNSSSQLYYKSSNSLSLESADVYGGFEESKVIITAGISIETKNLENALRSFDEFLNLENVKVMSKNTNKNDYSKTAYLSVKVPKEKLDRFVENIEKNFEVKSLRLSEDNVIETYEDITNKINRYKTQLLKYENMLLRENLSIQNEININSRIDQIENTLFYLQKNNLDIDDRVEFISVSINFKESKFLNIYPYELKDYVNKFLNGLQNALMFMLTILSYLIPFGILYLIYRYIKRKKYFSL